MDSKLTNTQHLSITYMGYEDQWFEQFFVVEFSKALYKITGIRAMYGGRGGHTEESYAEFREKLNGMPPTQEIYFDLDVQVDHDDVAAATIVTEQKLDMYYNMEILAEQIAGLDESYLNNFILNYGTFIIIYDYENDEIRGIVPLNTEGQGQFEDFLQKLNAHPELSDVTGQVPEGGRLNDELLAQLSSQFPDVYQNAQSGDFVLRYPKKLVIYNYEQDVIRNVFTVQ